MSDAKDAHDVTTAPHHAHIFRQLLTNMPVSSLLRNNMTITTVNVNDPVVTAFQTLVQHKILSAPVFDDEAKQFIGFLDVRDLVQFVVTKAEEDIKTRLAHAEDKKAHHGHHGHAHGHGHNSLSLSDVPLMSAPPPPAHSPSSMSVPTPSSSDDNHLAPPTPDLRAIFDASAHFHEASSTEEMNLRYFAKHHPFRPVSKDDSLLKVAELLSRGDVHRVPVLSDDHSTVLDIISQSTLVKALYEHRNELKEILDKKIDDVKLGSRPVVSMKTTSTALDTFRTLAKLGITGVAIVDESGRFVGNTSASDLKLFIQNPEKNMRTLQHPIIDFLNVIRRHDNPLVTKSPTISVRPDDSIERVVGKIHATHIHRIFVCSDKSGYKPEAVISITDLLRYVLDIHDSDVSNPDVPKITIDPV